MRRKRVVRKLGIWEVGLEDFILVLGNE